MHYGNSVATVPRFVANNQRVRCDIAFVDGDIAHDVVHADIDNFVAIAHEDHSVIMLDDYPTDWGTGMGVGKVWDDAVKRGAIRELMRCTFKRRVDGRERGFSLGKINGT